MQRMNRLWRFLELPPSPDEIVLFNKVWLKPWRKFRERVRTADPLPQPGAKASLERRGAPLLKDVPSLSPPGGPESPLAGKGRQVRAGLPLPELLSALIPNGDTRLVFTLSVIV